LNTLEGETMKKQRIIQGILGVIIPLVINTITVLPYFYFALGILVGSREFTVHEFSDFTTYGNMIMIPISYILLWGIISLLIYKWKKVKVFSIAFIITNIIVTSIFYYYFPSLLWF